LSLSLKNIVLSVMLTVSIQMLSAQSGNISYSASAKPLDKVLEEIGGSYGQRFAFDPDSFGKIIATFTIKNYTTEGFLEFLSSEFFIKSKLIDGTWVLTADRPVPLKTTPAIEVNRQVASGYIKDKITGDDLIYCNVALRSGGGAVTNELGFFRFEVEERDSVEIIISHLGYRRLDTLISAGDNHILLLEPSEIVLDPVKVVYHEKNILQASANPENIGFNPFKSYNFPRISDDDLGNLLLVIPGVNFLYGGTSGLSIRGSSPADNLVLFDGIPVLETSHLLGNMSVLNSKFVHQAFVSRGGFGTEYGDRASGLIKLTGKSGKNNRPYIDLSANLLNYNALVNLPVTSKFSVTAAWRRSFIDQWQNYLYFRLIDDIAEGEDDPVQSTIIPSVKYEDINGKISFHPSDNLEFNVNFLYGKDGQSRDFELMQTADYYRNENIDSENMGLSLNIDWQANDRWFHTFSAGFSTLDRTVIDETGELIEITEIIENPGQGAGKGKGLAKTREKTYTRLSYDIDNGFNSIEEYRAGWKTTFNSGIFQNEGGIGITADRYDYRFFANRTEAAVQIDSIVDHAELIMANGFFQQQIDFADILNFRWGIRANMDLKSSSVYLQPRGGVEAEPSDHIRFYFLSGVYYQFLNGAKRFDSEGHFNHIWYLPGEDGSGIARSYHNVIGGKFQKDGWFIDLEGYQKSTDGKINFFAGYASDENRNYIEYYPKNSSERVRGIDLFVQKKHSFFNHMAGYSVSATEEKIEDVFGGEWFPGYNDRLHRLKLSEMISWKGWHLTCSWHLASGLPVLQLTGSGQTEDFDRSEFLSRFDMAIVRDFRTKHFIVNAGASLLNIFDRENIIEVDYLRFASNSGSMTVRSDISALGFTPVFFLNLKIY
jgi:ferric enterobactin receptor